MKKIIGLAGTKSGFLQRLMDYVNGLGEAEAFLCTKERQLLEEIRHREPVVVFCMEDFARDELLLVPRVNFVSEQEQEDGIYQYQSASALYKEMRKFIWKETPKIVAGKGPQQIYAVYSPLGRCGKTSFACAYARSHSFFYISLEEYGIRTNNFCDKGNVLYYIKNRKEGITAYLKQAAEEWEGIQILGAPTLFTDIRDLEWEDFSWLIEQIRKDGSMPSVMMDFGSCCMVDFSILDLFDKVYLPILSGDTEERKLKQFRELVYEVNGRMEEKLVEIMVPNLSWKDRDFLDQIQYMDGLTYE